MPGRNRLLSALPRPHQSESSLAVRQGIAIINPHAIRQLTLRDPKPRFRALAGTLFAGPSIGLIFFSLYNFFLFGFLRVVLFIGMIVDQ